MGGNRVRRSRARHALFALGAVLAIAAGPARASDPTHTASVISYGMAGHFAYAPGGDADDFVVNPALVIPAGGTLEFTNVGQAEHHSVTSFARDPMTYRPLFDSGLVKPFGQTLVPGISALAPGRYGFYCTKHAWMRGELTIR